MTDVKKHHIVHDKPLVKNLLASFIVVVATGLILNQLVALFFEHHLPLDASTEERSLSWEHVERKEGIELLRRPIAGTQLYAYRAVTTVPLPLAGVMKVVRDSPHATDWIKDLVEDEEWHKSAHHEDDQTYVEKAIVRQKYKTIYPGVKPREYLMLRTLTTKEAEDGSGRTSVTADFISFDDESDEYPVCDGCVRGHNLGSTWKFTPLGDGKNTLVEADIITDPHMNTVSPFFVNVFQKKWIQVTTHSLVQKSMHVAGKTEAVTARSILRLVTIKQG